MHMQSLSTNLELLVEIDDGQFHGAGVINPLIEVQILLNDINDEEPEFSNLPTGILVPEVSLIMHGRMYTCLAARPFLSLLLCSFNPVTNSCMHI